MLSEIEKQIQRLDTPLDELYEGFEDTPENFAKVSGDEVQIMRRLLESIQNRDEQILWVLYWFYADLGDNLSENTKFAICKVAELISGDKFKKFMDYYEANSQFGATWPIPKGTELLRMEQFGIQRLKI